MSELRKNPRYAQNESKEQKRNNLISNVLMKKNKKIRNVNRKENLRFNK